MKIKSKKPSKQHKALFNSKNHQRSKLLTCRLADFVQEEFGIKRIPIRTGDSVRITKGEFKDFEGEVIRLDRKKRLAYLKEVQFSKSDGTNYSVPLAISKLIITRFGGRKKLDPWRSSMIERKAGYLGEDYLVAPKKGKKEEEK